MNRINFDYTELLVQINYVWIDLSNDQFGPVVGDWGMIDTGPMDRTAATGTMSFELINNQRLYTPGASTALPGWGKGLPVKLVFWYYGESFVRWRGVIDDIDIILGAGNEQRVKVYCVDWMNYAAKTPYCNQRF